MGGEHGKPPLYPAEGGSEEQVMSEVHLGCPPNHSGPHISHFTIALPPRDKETMDSLDSSGGKEYEVDCDGDLILTRRRRDAPTDYFVVSIQHNITSSIPRVGLQVWRAELVLADFVLHLTYKSSNLEGIVAIELGAGTGLVGMLLARVANIVFVTDKGDEVLENCAKNINLNAGIFHREASIFVRELDWNYPLPLLNSPSKRSYGWSASDLEELRRASLIFAADVIYSDELTDALFIALEAIMSNSCNKVLYLALEKRYNFSIDDLDVVANGYSHFRSYIKDEEDNSVETECPRNFLGRRINVEQIPQYVQEYERGSDVEIWEIKYKNKPGNLSM